LSSAAAEGRPLEGRTLATEAPEHDCQQDSGDWEADNIPNDANIPDVHVGKRYAG
jgi:hypothetical protein